MPTRTQQMRRRIIRPASKQILQIREDGTTYDDLSPSPYLRSSPSWSTPAGEDSSHVSCAGGGEDGEGAAGSAFAENVSGDEDDLDGTRGKSSSQNPHSTHAPRADPSSPQNPQASQQQHVVHHVRGRRGHTRQQSARRATAGSNSNSARGGRSGANCSRHALRTSNSSDVLYASPHGRRAVTPQQQQQHGGPASHNTASASPVIPGGHVTYYGSPCSIFPPATAGVFTSPSSSSSALVDSVDMEPSSCDGSPLRSSPGSASNAFRGNGRAHHHQRPSGSSNSSPSSLCANHGSRKSGGGGGEEAAGTEEDASCATAAAAANSGSGCVQSHSGDAATTSFNHQDTSRATAATAAADSANTTSTTPLTYAAVASTPSSTSTLHGKRLPQSRVNFGNFRKRTSTTGSVASTVGSVIGTPATAGTPLMLGGGAYSLNGSCCNARGNSLHSNSNGFSVGHAGVGSCSNGFPSVPLTPVTCTIPSGASTTNKTNGLSDRSPATPAMPGGVIGGGGSSSTGSGARCMRGCSTHDAESSNDSRDVGEDDEDACSGSCMQTREPSFTQHPQQQQQQQATAQLMPPLPPSLHRHHPTDLFLQLPCTPHRQPDSDDEEYAVDPTLGGMAAPSPLPCSTTTTTTYSVPHIAASSLAAQQRSQVDLTQDEFTRCKTSSTMTHTGPAMAAAMAAGLTLLTVPPLRTSFASMSASSFQSSGMATPGAPASAKQPLPSQTPTSSLYTGASPTTQASPGAGLLPRSSSNANFVGRGMHKVGSTLNMFNAVEIIPGLFLGSYADATDTEALAAHGISLVVNCSLECSVTPAMASNPHHVRYVQCPLRDHSDEAIAPFFTPVTRIIHDQLHRRQINQQRTARRAAAVAGGGNCSCNPECCGAEMGGVESELKRGATLTTPTATLDDDFGDAQELQSRMNWTWADEAENVWAVPPSPASPSLSVGGQPSLKEGKRETPRTPSSALGARFSDGVASAITSGSPSPMPTRTATFPGAASFTETPPPQPPCGAATATQMLPSAAKAAPPPPLPTAAFFRAIATTPTNNTGTHPSPPSAAAPPVTAFTTVVDPRDCGGVLVHCRMGVSRSATFVMAYLILYGFTLAHLEDTASLFVRFLEKERCIIEEAGGRVRFAGGDAGAASAPPAPTAAAIASNAVSTALHTPTTGNGNGAGVAPPRSAFPASLSGRLGTPPAPVTPAAVVNTNSASNRSLSNTSSSAATLSSMSSPLMMRWASTTPQEGLPTWFQQQQQQQQQQSARRGGGGGASTTSPALSARLRSAAVPAVASPLSFSAVHGIASPLMNTSNNNASSASMSSHSRLIVATPPTPIELAARVCRTCYLQRLRERRLQQQTKRTLLISGQLCDGAPAEEEEEAEAEQQRIARAAAARARGVTLLSPPRSTNARQTAEEDVYYLPTMGEDCDCDTHSRSVAQRKQTEAVARTPQFRPTAAPRRSTAMRAASSSAPVLSHRTTRGGGYGGTAAFGATLLQTALAEDEEADAMMTAAAAEATEKGDAEDDGEGGGDMSEMPTITLGKSTLAELGEQRTIAAAAAAPSLPLRNAFSVSKTSNAACPLESAAPPDPSVGSASQQLAKSPSNNNNTGSCALSKGNVNASASALFAGVDNASITSTHSVFGTFSDAAPAMTFREAFDAVKRQKEDVNPNIGFVLALRELAGGGDFSFSTSL